MSGPRVLVVIGVVILALFAVAVGLAMRDKDASFGDHGIVGSIRATLTSAGQYKASHVPADTPCFANNTFQVQGTCSVVIPKKVRRIHLQVLQGEPRGLLTQNPGRLGYKVLPADIKKKNGGMAVDMNGDGGLLILSCPTLCRMLIID